MTITQNRVNCNILRIIIFFCVAQSYSMQPENVVQADFQHVPLYGIILCMKKHLLILIFLSLIFAACRPQTGSTTPPANTTTPTAVTVKLVSTPTATPTITLTPTRRPTAAPTPTPTNTPVPAERLAAGQTFFHNGQFAAALTQFDALAADPAAPADDRRLGLYWRGRAQFSAGDAAAAADTFRQFVEKYPADDLTRPAQFNLAQALESSGTITDTLAAYDAAILPDDPIAAYIFERKGDVALAAEAFPAAAEAFAAALNHTTDTGFQVALREKLAQAYLGSKNFDRALAQYRTILDVAQIPAYRAKIMRLIGEAYLQAENTAAAKKQFQSVLDTYPKTFDAYLTLVDMVNADFPVDDFQRGYVDYYGGSAYQPAADALTRFLKTSPTQNADTAHWLLGWSWRALGDYDAAIDAFDAIITDFPDSEFWADANLQKARTLGWQGKLDDAIGLYRSFAAENSALPQADEALWKAALIEFQDDRFDIAAENFRVLATERPAGAYADDALFWAGLAAFQADNLTTAEQNWSDLLAHYPASEFARAASFWHAKALLARGDTTQAESLLAQLAHQPLNYYGLRAADLLAGHGVSPAVPLDLSPPTPSEQVAAEIWLENWAGLSENANLSALDTHLRYDPAFVRGEALLALGLRAEAQNEFETVRSNWADNPVALYQLSLAFRDRGLYRLSILTAQDLVRQSPAITPADVPKFIRRLVYPLYYQDLVTAQADIQQLDPALVFALMRQESLFNPDAHSGADARGLMQIIPTTGADIAERTGLVGYTADSLWLPYLNVQMGTWYIRQMLDFVGGNQFAALAAYNAGPGRVDRWFSASDDFDMFVALIPLNEPQTYIRRIYLNLSEYRDIYGTANNE